MSHRGGHGRPVPPRVHRRISWLAAVALVVGLLVVGALPAVAQTEGADTADDEETTDDAETTAGAVRLMVSELTGVLGPGTAVVDTTDIGPRIEPNPAEDLTMRVLVENAARTPLDGLRLVIQRHAPVTSRSELQDALDEGAATDPEQVLYDELLHEGEAVGSGAIAGVSARFGPEDVGWDEGGVYPLTVAVIRGTDVLAEANTAVVWLDGVITEPLLTSFVWPIDDRPWRGVNGNYPETVDQSIEPGGRLDVLIRTLERNRDAPVVLAPAAHLLEDLRDRADGFTSIGRQPDGAAETVLVDAEDPPAERSGVVLQRLRDLAEGLPFSPLAATYADADLTSLVQHGGSLTDLGAEAAIQGRRRLARLLERPPDAATHLAGGPLAPEVLDLVSGDQVLLPASAVEPTRTTGATAARPLRSASGRLFTALVADRRLSASFGAASSGAGPVIDAQRIVAETAQAWFERPTTDGRSLVLLPPAAWAPSAELAERLLEQLESAPWLAMTTPSRQATLGRLDDRPVDLVTLPSPVLASGFASTLQDVTVDLEAVGSALPEDATTIGGRRPADLRDILLRATSRWYHDGASGEAEALLRDVHHTVEKTFGDVVVASGSRVTLTSDTGEIPVTLQRTRGGPIAVRVEVASQGRLVWPEGQRSETIVLTEGAAETVSFPTKALSTGTLSVAVRVTDPTGTHVLERTTLSVRSTAISGTALAATGAAVLLLLLAGALRRRRPRRPRLEVVDGPPTGQRS